jgi:hypothetical protein
LERAGDLTGVRVELPGGSIRVASEHSLERVGSAEFGRYASSIGVALTDRQVRAAGR